MSNTYRLINPYIYNKEKQFETKSKNSLSAAKDLYGQMSSYFNNSLPEFYFSLEKLNDDESMGTYHFKVNEFKNSKNSDLKYKIKSFEVDESDNNLLLQTVNDINNNIKNNYDIELHGGAIKKKKKNSKVKKKKKFKKNK